MASAKGGDTVKVHYTGKFEDGAVFDSSNGKDPMQFKIGDGKLLAGFEQTVVGMKAGESRSTTLTPDEAYGQHNEQMVQEVDPKQMATDVKLEVGQHLEIRQKGGQTRMVTITALSDSTMTLDANHPLAGKTLVFDIELVEIL